MRVENPAYDGNGVLESCHQCPLEDYLSLCLSLEDCPSPETYLEFCNIAESKRIITNET